MWSPTEVFCGLFPSCSNCGASFDIKYYAPLTLSCAHTFCQSCLNRNRQRHKRRCFSCQKRYSSTKLNTCIIETIQKIKDRRDWLEQRSYRCDECDARRPQSALRRCVSCEDQISVHIPTEFKLSCAVCLECCVKKHNGHELVLCKVDSTSNSIVSHSNSVSEPASPDPRDPLVNHQETFSSWTADRFFSSKTFPFGAHRMAYCNDPRPVYFNNNRFSSEGVVCEESPVYRFSESLPSISTTKMVINFFSRLTSFARRFSSDSDEGIETEKALKCNSCTPTNNNQLRKLSHMSRFSAATTCDLRPNRFNEHAVHDGYHYANVKSQSNRKTKCKGSDSYDYITS